MNNKKLLIKSTIHGGVASVFGLILAQQGFNLSVSLNRKFINQLIPLWSLLFISGAANSLISDGLHYLIKEEISVNQKLLDDSSLILNLLMSAGSMNAIIYLLSPIVFKRIGVIKLGMIGAGSEMISYYLSEFV